jgi:hypothetical protein
MERKLVEMVALVGQGGTKVGGLPALGNKRVQNETKDEILKG